MAGFSNVQDMIAARGEKVRMKATAFGTVNGPYGILHTDPNGDDPLARNPVVWSDEADALVGAGLAKRLRTVTYEVDEDGIDAHDGSALGRNAAERLKEVTDAHDQVGSSAALDSRQTTAYGDNRVSLGVVDEAPESDAEVDEDDDVIDEAPTSGAAPKNKGGRPRKDAAAKE